MLFLALKNVGALKAKLFVVFLSVFSQVTLLLC